MTSLSISEKPVAHPPSNLVAEEHVLCAMMSSPLAIDNVRGLVSPRDFYRESHRHLYRAILDLHDRGIAVDPLTAVDELSVRGHLKGAFTADHVKEIASLLLPSSNAPHHARIVEKLARFRDLIRFADDVNKLGWEAGDWDASFATAGERFAAIQERTVSASLAIENWRTFESQSEEDLPSLVDTLWSERAFGFIAAGPKKGKTWLAIALAVSVATGKPFLGLNVPNAQPVLYVALEGHRSALRARIGAIARGMGIDPDTEELHNLHLLYKPPGMNLADPAWAARLHHATVKLQAKLTVIDVLRASARIDENNQKEFTALAHNLAPIQIDGCSIALLHHNGKLTEISRERVPGERMSGSGSMFGALDVAIYITGSDNHARDLRLEFDTRDIAGPEHLNVNLSGTGTGPNGGFTYRDAAAWVIADNEVNEDTIKAPPQEIYEYLIQNGSDVEVKIVCAHFELGDTTFRRRLTRLLEMGVQHVGGRGKPSRLIITAPPETGPEQLDLDPEKFPHQVPPPEFPHGGTSGGGDSFSHNHAGLREVPPLPPPESVVIPESADLQGKEVPPLPPPYGCAPTPAREQAPTHVRAHEETPNTEPDIDADEIDRLEALNDDIDWSRP